VPALAECQPPPPQILDVIPAPGRRHVFTPPGREIFLDATFSYRCISAFLAVDSARTIPLFRQRLPIGEEIFWSKACAGPCIWFWVGKGALNGPTLTNSQRNTNPISSSDALTKSNHRVWAMAACTCRTAGHGDFRTRPCRAQHGRSVDGVPAQPRTLFRCILRGDDNQLLLDVASQAVESTATDADRL